MVISSDIDVWCSLDELTGFCVENLLRKDIPDQCRLWDARKEGRKVLQVASYLFIVFVSRPCFKKIVPIGADSGTNGRNGRMVLEVATSSLFSSPELASKRFGTDSGTNGRKGGRCWRWLPRHCFRLQSLLQKDSVQTLGLMEGRKVLQVATSLTGESTVRVGIIYLLQQQATACCAGCYLIAEHAHSFQFTRSMP